MKTPAQIAAAIAAELRAHPERWTRYDTGGSWSAPESPRCLIGLIQQQDCDARGDLQTMQAFGRHVPELPFLRLAEPLTVSVINTEIFSWNDDPYTNVNDVIGLCDTVAGRPLIAEVAS